MKGICEMKPFKNGTLNIPSEEIKVEILNLPTIEIERDRYDEFIRKEAQLEFVKKWIKDKTSYNNYADISDLLLLLDIKKG